MTLPRLAASCAISVRIQCAMADAMGQRRIAAGFTETRLLSGSTTASSRTRSSPPQPPAPWMSGMLGAMAISSVSASRQAEGAGGAGVACSAGLSVSAGARFPAAGLSGSLAGASAGRGLGNGTEAESAARRAFGLACANGSLRGACDQTSDFRAAAGGAVCAKSISSTAAAVTISLLPQANPL